jgi:hypothetical protein
MPRPRPHSAGFGFASGLAARTTGPLKFSALRSLETCFLVELPTMRTLPLGVCFLIAVEVHASANMPVKDYRAAMASKDESVVSGIKLYLLGLGDGLEWASVDTVIKKGVPLYCPPEKLVLTLDNFIQMINSRIEANSQFLTEKQLNETQIGLLLLEGLEETFPCKEK